MVPLKEVPNNIVFAQIREVMKEPDLSDPDIAGEILRKAFFAGDGYRDLDNVADNVRKIEDTPVEDSDYDWHNYVMSLYKGGIWMSWYWEGDGTLKFTFIDGTSLVNYDCKKDHGWVWEYPKN